MGILSKLFSKKEKVEEQIIESVNWTRESVKSVLLNNLVEASGGKFNKEEIEDDKELLGNYLDSDLSA